jgi:hypothetical protein
MSKAQEPVRAPVARMIFLIGLGMLTFQGFATPTMLASGYTDVLASLSYLPRLPAASHDYLPPPTTTFRLPRLRAASP